MKEYLNILYKVAGGVNLLIDLYMPDGREKPPLIMWIHGGAWLGGDRKSPMLLREVERGYALASIEYRFSSQGIFPCNIIDCKDALDFLRKNADNYGYDPKNIAVAGDSAGGHLAALMGVSAGHADWESQGGDYSVQAVIDYYGPTAFDSKWPDAALDDSPVTALLGATIRTAAGRARAALASPLTYIGDSTPPFLILHGDCDPLVPYSQSTMLRDALEAAGISAALYRVHGAGHGFSSKAADAAVDEFLDYLFL